MEENQLEKLKRLKADPKEIEFQRKKEQTEREEVEEHREQSDQEKKKSGINLSTKRKELEKTATQHEYIDKRHCDKYIKNLKKINHTRLQDISNSTNKELRKLMQEVIDEYNQNVDIVHTELNMEEKLNKACEIVIERYRPSKQSFIPKPKGEFTRKLTSKFIEIDIVKAVHILGHVGKEKQIKIISRFSGSRLVVNANPESKNIALQGLPGVGKDSTIKRTKLVLFPSKWLHYDCISQTFFDHKMAQLNEDEIKDTSDLIVYYEDLDEATLNSKHFRTLLSSAQRHAGWTNKDLDTTEAEYPKIPIIMTLGSEIDMDNHTLRRVSGFWIENTSEHRKKVAQKAVDNFESIPFNFDSLKEDERNFIMELIERTENLKKVLVTIPDELKEYIKNNLLPDKFDDDKQITDVIRLLDFIKFSGALNQENMRVIKENQTVNIEGIDITYNVIETNMIVVKKGYEMFKSYMEVQEHKKDENKGKQSKRWIRKDKKKDCIYKILDDADGNELTYKPIMNKLKDKYQISISVPTLYNKLDQLVEEKEEILETTIENNLNQEVRAWYRKPVPKPVN